MVQSGHSLGRVHARAGMYEKETSADMATSDFFWKLFKTTGSINAYLIYRQLHPSPTSS
ncbi:MAG: hypothetical protein DLM50_01050 [Candidatus Meridianibacter frigidus]|nr:MAG: hypothetical protein DLM50_01050 [Candidatus Eremiobacteraeota bacterium]